jgi:hypothetical protein
MLHHCSTSLSRHLHPSCLCSKAPAGCWAQQTFCCLCSFAQTSLPSLPCPCGVLLFVVLWVSCTQRSLQCFLPLPFWGFGFAAIWLCLLCFPVVTAGLCSAPALLCVALPSLSPFSVFEFAGVPAYTYGKPVPCWLGCAVGHCTICDCWTWRAVRPLDPV